MRTCESLESGESNVVTCCHYNIVNIINGWDFLHSAPHNCKISLLQDVSQACILLPPRLTSEQCAALLRLGNAVIKLHIIIVHGSNYN